MQAVDVALRPNSFADYMGQDELKERLQLHIESATKRHQALNHMLLAAAPGYGKTSLAQVIASEAHQPFYPRIAPIAPIDIYKLMKSYTGIILLDEAQRIPTKQQEQFLSVIEDNYFALADGARLQNDNVTWIFATTEPDQIIPPLWDRFARPAFASYSDDEMGRIVASMANKLDLIIPPETAVELGRATGGVPRNAKSLVFMARDLYTVTNEIPSTELILAKAKVTAEGLTQEHVNYLKALEKAGGTAGVKIIAALTRMPEGFLVSLEPLLVDRGYVVYSPRGRKLVRAIGDSEFPGVVLP